MTRGEKWWLLSWGGGGAILHWGYFGGISCVCWEWSATANQYKVILTLSALSYDETPQFWWVRSLLRWPLPIHRAWGVTKWFDSKWCKPTVMIFSATRSQSNWTPLGGFGMMLDVRQRSLPLLLKHLLRECILEEWASSVQCLQYSFIYL